jgi:hypothetical protein
MRAIPNPFPALLGLGFALTAITPAVAADPQPPPQPAFHPLRTTTAKIGDATTPAKPFAVRAVAASFETETVAVRAADGSISVQCAQKHHPAVLPVREQTP